ncbi:MAG: hypothetical protein AAFQ82_25270, partial [Myxococcota bacterium]
PAEAPGASKLPLGSGILSLESTECVASIPSAGVFFAVSGEAPEIFRFEVGADGRVERTGPLSFAARGVSLSDVPPRLEVVSGSKGYYLDEQSGRAFVFDPSGLTISSEFALSGLEPTSSLNLETVLGTAPARRGTELLYPVLYRNLVEGTSEVLARVLLLDTEDDSTAVIEDSRCGYLTNSVVAANGDAYFSSDAFNGAFYAARPEENGTSCILRIRSGERAFDPTFIVQSEAVTGTTVSGGMINAGDDVVYVLGYDPEVVPLGASYNEVLGAPAWRTYQYRLGEVPGEPQEVSSVPLRSGAVSPITLTDIRLDVVTSADFSSSTLFELNPAGSAVEGLSAPGAVFSVLDLR